jgi:hypothetical protein
MKKTLVIAFVMLLVVAFASTSAFAFKLPGGKDLPGKSDLKKEVKAFTLADVNAALKEYEGTEMDPGKDKKFATTVYGDADFDAMAISLTKIELGTAFANGAIADANAKIAAAQTADDLAAPQKALETALTALQSLATEGATVAAKAPAFGKALPGKVKKDPLGYGKNASDMTKVVNKLPKAVAGIPDTVKAVTDTVVLLKEKIASFAK